VSLQLCLRILYQADQLLALRLKMSDQAAHYSDEHTLKESGQSSQQIKNNVVQTRNDMPHELHAQSVQKPKWYQQHLTHSSDCLFAHPSHAPEARTKEPIKVSTYPQHWLHKVELQLVSSRVHECL